MTILDILIIYLACGSPFAVSSLMKPQGKPILRNILSSGASALFWPLLIPSAFKRVIEGQKVSDARSGDLVDSPSNLFLEQTAGPRRSLENEGLSRLGESELVRLRRAIDRYTGISSAINADRHIESLPNFELFEISGHTDGAAANACLSRRNRQRLEMHQTIARSDLLDAVFHLEAAGSLIAIETAIELARSVGDRDGEAELVAMRTDAAGKAKAA